ncbi:proteasome subunit alpha type-1-like [Halichondria panicea]|uniref:proteasome subunit alpha type-1-like n=1 Tax=Halichondria panicea TaxID=6063 RepID=UPI00312BA590
MFRNQYDNDVTIWSPQGRIHQIEYAMEAVKQGSATVGIKSETHVVLVALKRSSSELSSYQKKIYPVDDHVAVSIAGLTSDGRGLGKFMRTECLNSRYVYSTPLPISRLVTAIGDKMQVCTQFYGRRPYGVGMLVAGYDSLGPHLYQTCPSSNFYDCKAMSIGARSQSARTYLEKHLDEFKDSSRDDLIKHALLALRDCLPSESELTEKNVSVAVVGGGQDLIMYEDDKVQPFLDTLDSTKGGRSTQPAATPAAAEASEGAEEATPTEEQAMDQDS